MEKTINIIVAIVIVAAVAFFIYTTQREQIRKKEIEKKLSDNLNQQKEINEIILEKLKSGDLNVVGFDKEGNANYAKVKSKKKKNVEQRNKN
jgi:preprotein translocase subunit YajC